MRLALALAGAAALLAGGVALSLAAGSAGSSGLRLTPVEVGFRHGAFRWSVTADPVAMMGGGVCFLDYDADGWLDLFAVNGYAELERGAWGEAGGLPTSRLYRNQRGRFADVTDQADAELAVRGQGCVAADLDLDGHTDLYVTTADFGQLLWNDGSGGFVQGAEAAGVDAFGWHTGAAVGDVDGDGLPDLFVAGYVDLNNPVPGATLGFPNTHRGRRDLLFLNRGDRTFVEVGESVGLDRGNEYGLGASFADVDRDGDLDLYVANDTNPNRLYLNEPAPGPLGLRLVEAGATLGVADEGSGMGVAAGDYDAAAGIDLFVTNLGRQRHALLRNAAGGFVADPGIAGLEGEYTGWGASWGDLDLDTDLDLVVVNGAVPVSDLEADRQPLQVFMNRMAEGGAPTFELLDPGVPPILGRGSALADFDNDGDLDLAVQELGGELRLLRNQGARGRWLVVAPAGAPPGTVVTVRLEDGSVLERELRAGSSYLSSEDPRAHFGLGDMDRAEVEVRWPGGEVTTVGRVPADRITEVAPP